MSALLPQPAIVDTDPTSSFVCDYVAGINRVLSLPPYVVVDNIGRNFEVWRFESGDADPVARSRYDRTSYPGDPSASLLDVDLHAAFLRHDGRELVAVNHYGRVRRFDGASPETRLRCTGELQLLGDMERIALAGDCFVGSSPQGEFTPDRAQPGIFLFEPMGTWPGSVSDVPRRLAHEQVLADWGVITGLTVSEAGDRLAVAAGARVGVFDLTRSPGRVTLGDCRWDAVLDVHGGWLEFDGATRLWIAGPRADPLDGSTDTPIGGVVASVSVDDGTRFFAAPLPDVTGWGYGADPLVQRADGRAVYVLGRDASLHVIDVASGGSRQLYAPPTIADRAAGPLGIPHAAVRDGWLYAGFSRGGFWLLRYDLHDGEQSAVSSTV